MNLSTITTYQSGVAQSAAYRNLHKLFSGMLKGYDLTCMQWFILGTIYDSGDDGIQLTQLSSKLQTGLPFITNSINLLESKGMVERRGSPRDSRSKYVSLRDNFHGTCEQIEKDLREQMRRSIYADIDRDDFRVYLKVLHQLSRLKTPEPTVQSNAPSAVPDA